MKKIIFIFFTLLYTSVLSAQSFVTTWETKSAGETITIPTSGTGYNYTVEWGDGNVETGVTGNATHAYASPGIYTVSISGDFPRIYFNNSGDVDKIKSIEQWGSIQWRSMSAAFSGCSTLTYNATDVPDLSNVTSINSMFRYCSAFNGDLSGWDVSKVSIMNSVFDGATSFNGDISKWDVSSATYMIAMFNDASSFNQDISKWNTGNVISMQYMFYQATSFNQDISKWNTSKVMNTQAMFYEATSFNQPIGEWDLSSDTTMAQMFTLASSFNGDIKGWNTSKVINMRYMFYGATSFNQSLADWDVSAVKDMSYMFAEASSFNEDLDKWLPISAATMEGMFNKALAFNRDISGWDVSNVANMNYMFSEATSFNQNIDSWKTSSVTTMDGMFTKAYAFNQNLNSWDVSSVTSMQYMFSNATAFNGNIGAWNVSSVNNMNLMFTTASSFNQDIGNWDVSSVTNMNLMFASATSFDQDLGDWDIRNVTNLSNMLLASAMTVESFDKTLIGWAALSFVRTGLAFGGGNLKYCLGEAARNFLVNTYGWSITATKNCSNITPIDIRLSSASISEMNAVNAVIGLLNSRDQNQVDVHTYALVSGTGDADNASFTISGNQLRASTIFDYETKSVYSIRIQTTDDRGAIFSKEFSISILNVKENQTISFSPLADKTYGDAAFLLSATSSSGLPVSFTSSNPAVATISGTTVTILGAGSTNISAIQQGNENFNAASMVVHPLLIQKASQTITIAAIEEKETDDLPFEISASTTSGLTLNYSVTGPATIRNKTITLNGTVGTVTLTVSQAGNSNYEPTNKSLAFEVVAPIVSGIHSAGTKNVSTYPNPAQDYVIIRHAEDKGAIELFDIRGSLLKSQESTGTESILELTNLPGGIYFIRLGSSNAYWRIVKN